MALIDNITNYWKLDESSGNIADSVGGLSGTNTSITFSAGKINNGASLDAGTDNFLFNSTSLISGTSDFSLSLWIKYTSGVFIVSRRSANPGNWQLVYNAGKLYFTVSDGTTNLFEGSSITLDSNWHHIVVTRSGSNWVLYKDGSSVSTASNSGSLSTGAYLTLGDDAAGDGQSLVGMLDEVGIWSRALSSGEVTSLYNSGNGIQYPFTNIKTVEGISKSSVKVVSGVAIASVKSICGII